MCSGFLFFIAIVLDYCTSASSTGGHNFIAESVTPATRLRTVRFIHPSNALKPPFLCTTTTEHEDSIYEKVIVHHKDEVRSRIRRYIILFLF